MLPITIWRFFSHESVKFVEGNTEVYTLYCLVSCQAMQWISMHDSKLVWQCQCMDEVSDDT